MGQQRKPSIEYYNPDPSYLRGVISGIKDPSLYYGETVSIRSVARRIGVNDRTMRKYLSDSAGSKYPAPYVVQYAIESLADNK